MYRYAAVSYVDIWLWCSSSYSYVLRSIEFQKFRVDFHKFHAGRFQKCSRLHIKNAENGFGFDFLEWYHDDGIKLLIHILRVIGDETWAWFVNGGTKDPQSSGCTCSHWTNRKIPNKVCQNVNDNCLLCQRKNAHGGFMQRGTTITSEVNCEMLKKTVGPWECWHPVQCSSMTMRAGTELLSFENCWNISIGSCFTTLLTALISLRTTTTCSATWRTGSDHSVLTILRSWWKVP
jgi:hypothetical protein